MDDTGCLATTALEIRRRGSLVDNSDCVVYILGLLSVIVGR